MHLAGTKAARNEQRKLRATFWNNLAVGAALSGIVLPYLAYYGRIAEALERAGRAEAFTLAEWRAALVVIAAACLAFYAARTFRRWANDAVARIEE